MKTKIIPITDQNILQTAVEALQHGKVVGFPTDTVYGIAVPVSSRAGIDQLFQIKQRSADKPIAVLVGALSDLPLLTNDFNPTAQHLVNQFWPGALTIIVRKAAGLPDNLSSNENIAVRMPNHPFLISLLKLTGPLATTSANLSGGRNPNSAGDVMLDLDGRIDFLIDGGPTPGLKPSTVVDCTGPELVILREGAISSAELQFYLRIIK